jgi:hypothetical protein
MSLSMVKQEVKSDMCVEVFVRKDNCASKIQDLVSLPLPKRWDYRLENVALKADVHSKLYLAQKGKTRVNNQAAISSQFPGALNQKPFAHMRCAWGILATTY